MSRIVFSIGLSSVAKKTVRSVDWTCGEGLGMLVLLEIEDGDKHGFKEWRIEGLG